MIPFYRFRFSNRFLYIRLHSSSSDPLPLDIHSSSDLIRKQQWRALKFLTKSTNPNRFLQQLDDWNAPYDVVLQYFKWSEQEFHVSHSLEHYCKLFYLLANANRYDKIRSLLDNSFTINAISKYSCCSILRMLHVVCDNVCANSIIVDLLILAYVNNSNTDLGFEAFDRAGDYGLKLSVISCNQLINLLVKEEKFGRAEFVYREMIKRRIEVNLGTFNMVINGLCKAGRLHKAEDVFEDMQVRGILPSVVTYNTLIDGYCKKGGAGKMYKADALMKEMVKRKIFPNNITYNALIGGFCKVENVSAAMNLFKKMQVSGLKPDVVTYNSLINGLCCLGKPDEALALRDQMVDSGVEPSLVTFNVVMTGFSKKKMVDKCKEVFNDISKQGLVPNTYTYNILLNAYFQAGNLEDAAKLYKSMEGAVSPNVSTYNSLIAGYSREGDTKTVNRLVDNMKDRDLKADIVTYNILIGALCKKGESREAVKLLNEMSRGGDLLQHFLAVVFKKLDKENHGMTILS
ncbi:hypothetical protein E3N88_08550 [Mikania micrantha]|uniref:Pentacotripeptide-repeat region of PRORP domain-containing protein n=1 Tax=Mikania micrantha TaxID=192012 RepID=A0A5N6PGL3_9ASTR|nr:hypothetical protein E3N88_08550 [Mikania micrantha]